MFNIDFTKRMQELLPANLAKPRFKEFVAVLVSPVVVLYDKFQAARNATNYKLQFNAQVMNLEHFLNDEYDDAQRRIFIEDKNAITTNYIFNNIENRAPLYVYNRAENMPVYLRNGSEYRFANDFIIWVPLGVSFDETIMRSQVNTYNLAGKQFEIQNF